jgi:hypothetical protein
MLWRLNPSMQGRWPCPLPPGPSYKTDRPFPARPSGGRMSASPSLHGKRTGSFHQVRTMDISTLLGAQIPRAKAYRYESEGFPDAGVM